jgi:hypothetical protein
VNDVDDVGCDGIDGQVERSAGYVATLVVEANVAIPRINHVQPSGINSLKACGRML